MKKTILTYSVMVLCFLSSTNSLRGQEYISPPFFRQLKLSGETDVKEITMPLRDSLDYISFKITSVLKSGEIKVELYDPAGEKHGFFILSGSLNPVDKNEDIFVRKKTYISDATGNLLRTIKNPTRGLWKAKVISTNAFGVINFEFSREMTVFKME